MTSRVSEFIEREFPAVVSGGFILRGGLTEKKRSVRKSKSTPKATRSQVGAGVPLRPKTGNKETHLEL